MGVKGRSVEPRAAAWLAGTRGPSDVTLRGVGVLGLAICLAGPVRQRLVLRG